MKQEGSTRIRIAKVSSNISEEQEPGYEINIFTVNGRSYKMKRAVVILEELSKEDIEFYTKRRRGRPARKKKTEASRNLRDIERVDFSLYENYRKIRTNHLKKSEKRKRSKKLSPKSEKKPRKKKSKIASKSLEQVSFDHETPPSDLTPKSSKKSKKNKKRKKDPESTPKSKKKKLRRVIIEESESDGDIESYGLFYTEGKDPQNQINGFQDPQNQINGFQGPQKQVNGFQDPQDFMDVPPLQFFDYAAAPPSMSFVNLFSAGVDNDSDDILSALAIGSDDSFAHLGIQDPLSSVPIETSFLSTHTDKNVDAEGIASKIVSQCESVKSGCTTKHILDQFDVVGDIFNLMDSNFSCRTNVPNLVSRESLTPVPQQQHDTRVMGSAPVVETLSQKSARIITPNCSLEDAFPVVKQVLDTLVKKVSARNKRNISLQSKGADKCINKKCSLCSQSFMQVKNETLCSSCKSYALGQLSSGPKNSIIKRTDKPLEQSLQMKSTSLQKNTSDMSNSSQKINAKPIISQTTSLKKSTSKFSPLTLSTKRIAVKKKVEPVSVHNENTPRRFRSTILLPSPVKLNFKKSPTKRSLKKSPIKTNFKLSPLQRKLSPKKKCKSLDSDSRKKLKAPNAGNVKKVLKNFPANERHRILYKNNAKSKTLLIKDDKETKSDNVESENMTFEAAISISMNCTLNSVVNSQDFHITPIKPIMVAEEHKDSLFPEASSKSTTKQQVNEKNLQTSNSDDDKDFSSQKFSINNGESVDCVKKVRSDESKSKTVKIFAKHQENMSVVSKSSLEEYQTAINDIEASGNIEVVAENNMSSNVSQIHLTSTDDTSSIKPVNESSRVFDHCVPEVPAEMTVTHLNETKDDYNVANSIALNTKINSTVSKNSSASETSINSSSLQSLAPVPQFQQAVGTIILNPVPQVLSLTPLTVVTISNNTPVITVLPISTVSSAKTSQALAQGTVSYPSTQLSEETTISSVSKSNENIASMSSQNLHIKEIVAPGTSAAANAQQNSQAVSPSKSNLKLSLKSNSNESPTQRALYELEAFAILSVLDMDTELDPEHTRHYIERLLRKEITTFKNVKNVNLADLNEDMAKLVQAKFEQSCYRIKSLIAACVLWIQCGSLKKVEEHILSKQFSQAITMADKEFENRKFGNDLESWYSRDVVAQAKMERMEKSDCMFSRKTTSTENNMFPNCETNTSRTLNNPRIPVPPFIEDAFSDELEPLEVVFNPKLETSNSCMYSNNTIVDSVVPNVHDLNYGSMSMNNTIQSSVMVPDLGHLGLPSPLQSPAGSLTHGNFNASPIARINERSSQILLPQASQIANQFDSNMNSCGNVPRMSPSVLQSQSPRSVSGLNHNIHNINVPGLSPRSLQSPSAQPFNPLDLDSLLTQTMVGSSRRNSRNSTSSIEPPVPQMSPVTVKQEKDLLSKSPCPNANNAIVPYGFLPTPSPTPPQPIVTQTQLQQPLPNQQLTSLLTARLNSAQSAQLKSQLQQLSPQYANLLRNVSHQASDAPRPNIQTALNRLVLLNQSAHQVPTSLVHRVAPPNRVLLPFNNNNAAATVNMGRNIPPNVTLQGSPHPNFLNNKNMAANVSLQLQNSNTNQIVPPNVSLHLPGSNLNIGVNRALPSNVSMSVQNINSGGNASYGQQQAPTNNTLVPVSLQQFLLSGNSSVSSVNTRVPTQNNFNNFLVPYSNPSNNYIPSQQTVMNQPNANANNVLFGMLAQPQPNAYTVHSQAKTNLRPPPPLYSASSNTPNNPLTPPSNTQSEKQSPTHSLMYCAVCSKPATMRCKQCTKVVYCNATCARIYWHQKHKMECKVPC